MQLKEVRKLTHLLIHLGMSGSIKIIYFHLWFVSKLKSSLVLDSLTVESRKEKSCNILCCRVCPCPGWWCLHTHSGHHPFIGRDTQKWADMKHLPEEIAKERQEIARFVPKKHPLLLILKNWSVHTGTNYELKGSEKTSNNQAVWGHWDMSGGCLNGVNLINCEILGWSNNRCGDWILMQSSVGSGSPSSSQIWQMCDMKGGCGVAPGGPPAT